MAVPFLSLSEVRTWLGRWDGGGGGGGGWGWTLGEEGGLGFENHFSCVEGSGLFFPLSLALRDPPHQLPHL